MHTDDEEDQDDDAKKCTNNFERMLYSLLGKTNQVPPDDEHLSCEDTRALFQFFKTCEDSFASRILNVSPSHVTMKASANLKNYVYWRFPSALVETIEYSDDDTRARLTLPNFIALCKQVTEPFPRAHCPVGRLLDEKLVTFLNELVVSPHSTGFWHRHGKIYLANFAHKALARAFFTKLQELLPQKLNGEPIPMEWVKGEQVWVLTNAKVVYECIRENEFLRQDEIVLI